MGYSLFAIGFLLMLGSALTKPEKIAWHFQLGYAALGGLLMWLGALMR